MLSLENLSSMMAIKCWHKVYEHCHLWSCFTIQLTDLFWLLLRWNIDSHRCSQQMARLRLKGMLTMVNNAWVKGLDGMKVCIICGISLQALWRVYVYIVCVIIWMLHNIGLPDLVLVIFMSKVPIFRKTNQTQWRQIIRRMQVWQLFGRTWLRLKFGVLVQH